MKLSPIVLFVYNRLKHTRQTVEALQKNELANESVLFIYADNAKNDQGLLQVQEVRNYLKMIDGFKKITIIERDKNLGLVDSIIDGVTNIINQYGKIIVMEDDLVTSPYFLKYMNNALDFYENEKSVASIHGYIYPIENLPNSFFIKGADCWGWATWKRAWNIFEIDGQKLLNELTSKKLEKKADFNSSYGYTKMLKRQIKGKNNSWAIRWYMSAFLKNMVTLYPGKSYVKNIGLDGTGMHCSGGNDAFNAQLNTNLFLDKIKVVENIEARKKMEVFFLSIKKIYFENLFRKLNRF